MSVRTFVATHCGETFTGAEGAEDLRAHMLSSHGVKPIKPGDKGARWEKHGSPGWRNGEIERPIPWVAPKPCKSLQQVAARWGDEVEYFNPCITEEVAAA